ncbi:hydrogenase subunit MbhD domain-containing protein [Halodurantibacterium flavum]|uniref:Hydrogenase subunit MbhD domain-containing protein n=1 Tax=Halodurantibacterium flavum TaxID=1382802 RepID=A0ABW4S6B3_9RHOB
MTALFDGLLCLMIAGVALAAVAGRGVFRAVVVFIVYGVFVAIGWLRLGAVDVAMAEAAIGAGLTGLLLLRAYAALPVAEAGRRASSPILPALAGLGVAVALGLAFLALPEGRGLAPMVAERAAGAGAENPVTAVLLAFRAWDTLLESVVLLAALCGVLVLSRGGDWAAPPGLRQHARPDGVLASFGRILPPVGLIVGVYLVWAGTSRPGGAFQGGTVLAAVLLLAAMAGVVRMPGLGSRWLRAGLVIGPAVFLAAGLLGIVLSFVLPGAGFLVWPGDWAKTVILGIELALTLSIALALAALVAGPPEEAG